MFLSSFFTDIIELDSRTALSNAGASKVCLEELSALLGSNSFDIAGLSIPNGFDVGLLYNNEGITNKHYGLVARG